jgi:hypothetical protein
MRRDSIMGEEGDDADQHCGMEVQGALSSQVVNLLVLFFVNATLVCGQCIG